MGNDDSKGPTTGELGESMAKTLADVSNSFRRSMEALADSPTIKALAAQKPPIFALPSMTIPPPPLIPSPRERESYKSAAVLIRRLAETITAWRQALPTDEQPLVVALLHGGTQIDVDLLAVESFDGIRIEGKVGTSPCMVLAHQATVQLLCIVQKVEKEEFRRKIGFIIDGDEQRL
jgi:hypothetical protein